MRNVEDRTRSRPSRRGWLASPALSLVVGVGWVLLQGTLSASTLLWAALLALFLPWLVHDFLGRYGPLSGARAAIRLLGVVLWDIVRANLSVARIVLEPGFQPSPAWIRVPYSLTDPRGIVLLASIVTNTPGTISAVIDEERCAILVHALHAPDPQAVADEIRERYERPLKEIFR
jgi:multicomponent K+:H+ antiporter subunit E